MVNKTCRICGYSLLLDENLSGLAVSGTDDVDATGNRGAAHTGKAVGVEC